MSSHPVEIEIECGPRYFIVEGHAKFHAGYEGAVRGGGVSYHVDTVHDVALDGSDSPVVGDDLANVLTAHGPTFLTLIEESFTNAIEAASDQN